MPWSPWIQSADYNAGVVRLFFQERYGTDPSVTGFNQSGPAVASAGFPTSIEGQGEQSGTQFTDYGDWATDRDWFPTEMDELVEGVDYAIRPDRTVSDQDAYVEYESDAPNQLVDWFVRAPTVASASGGSSWQLYLVDGTTIVFGANGAPTSGGTPFASGNGSTPVGTVLPVPPQPTTTQFSIIGRLDSPFTEAAFSVNYAAPSVNYRMPRWRYWIPGDSHVRLLHRGDGLGMNAKRLRTGGHTHQAGRLRGSY